MGSGASLSSAQIRTIAMAKLERRARVIAVNDAVYPLWGIADWLHACDWKWWNHHIQRVQHFSGIKTTLSDICPDAWGIGYLKETGQQGFDADPGNCRTGSNGAYQALHCALHTRTPKVLLVGVDMKGKRFFGRHWDGIETDYASSMLPHWPTILPAARELRTEIVNCSTDSALTVFRMGDLEQELK